MARGISDLELSRHLLQRPDWIAFVLTAGLTVATYLWTLAPDVNLEDGGNLAVAAWYAGVPHPPGYPTWTLYSWLFTVLLPFSNIAWRVSVASAVAASLASAGVALMIARAGRGFIESLDTSGVLGPTQRACVCLVSAVTGGLVMGFSGFLWSQAVIVEVYPLSVLSLVVTLLFLQRHLTSPALVESNAPTTPASPRDRRALYAAAFAFGIAFTNHQTLIVAAMGIQVFILAADRRLGRDAFFANTAIYLLGSLLMSHGSLASIRTNPALNLLFHAVGLGSMLVWIVHVLRDRSLARKRTTEGALASAASPTPPASAAPAKPGAAFTRDRRRSRRIPQAPSGCATAGTVMIGAILITLGTALLGMILQGGDVANPTTAALSGTHAGSRVCYGIACAALAVAGVSGYIHRALLTEGRAVLASFGLWCMGAAAYLLLPLLSATNPPMNWGYPRTWDGFVHAFTRGQYEPTRPSMELGRILEQFGMLFESAVEEFNVIFLFIALVPFLHWMRLRRRDRAWLIGLGAIYTCLAFLLVWLLNPNLDRTSRDLTKVFFAASHVPIALAFGGGLVVLVTRLMVDPLRVRPRVSLFAAAAVGLSLFVLVVTLGPAADPGTEPVAPSFGIQSTGDPSVRLGAWTGFALAMIALSLVAFRTFRTSPRLVAWLALIALLPVKTLVSHWADNEQRGHLFGYWFGHDMFRPPFEGSDGRPLYPEMPRNAVLFGGTDAGRFNPTYMIFCESFLAPRHKPRDPTFDRRDVYLITQNALADPAYLNYIRAHYNNSAQRALDTPFLQEMLRPKAERANGIHTNALARMAAPFDRAISGLGRAIETSRRAGSSWFQASDFVNLAGVRHRLRAGSDPFSAELGALLHPETTRLLGEKDSDSAFAASLALDLNRILEANLRARLDTHVDLEVEPGSRLAPADDARCRLFRPDLLKNLPLSGELRRLIAQDLPTPNRVRACRRVFEEVYLGLIARSPGGLYPDLEIHIPTPADLSQAYNTYVADAYRRKLAGQLRPGEDVREADGHLTMAGFVSIMSVNGLLARAIFEANPDHEFFIEESAPIEWMYPHLAPYGIILQIHRDPLPGLGEDILQRDRAFWQQYSNRLVGDSITFETTVDELCTFIRRVHGGRDLSGFGGDRRFLRDAKAQQCFSKLRGTIGGLYLWRATHAGTAPERERLIVEAEFALRQAIAFRPTNPEAILQYAQLKSLTGRLDEALRIADTAFRVDPSSTALGQIREQLRQIVIQKPARTVSILRSASRWAERSVMGSGAL